jgi:predicted Fe-Mo cluster-binding NifX family protein
MKLGIIGDELEKSALKIIAEHPDVLSAFLYNSVLTIESVNIDQVVNDLEEDHGLHLIINGDGDYMIASSINEVAPLAAAAAAAGIAAASVGARAASAAANAGVKTLSTVADTAADVVNDVIDGDEEKTDTVEDAVEEEEMEQDKKKNPAQIEKEAQLDAREDAKKMDKREKDIAIKKRVAELGELGLDIGEIGISALVDWKTTPMSSGLIGDGFVRLKDQ